MPTVIAIAAHPDDIEFVMAGTLLLLGEAGWELHYLNLSSGNLGSTTMSPARTAQVRRKEAQAAAIRRYSGYQQLAQIKLPYGKDNGDKAPPGNGDGVEPK